MNPPLESAPAAPKSGLFPWFSRRIVAVTAVCLVAWFLIAWGAARLLIVSAPLSHADAIAVLSGSAAYRERTRYAAQLFKGGYGQRIIVTNDNHQGGWSPTEERNPYYYELEVAELRHAGIPQDKIVVMREPVGGTSDEAILFRRYAEKEGLQSILVVTQWSSCSAHRVVRLQPNVSSTKHFVPGTPTLHASSMWTRILHTPRP